MWTERTVTNRRGNLKGVHRGGAGAMALGALAVTAAVGLGLAIIGGGKGDTAPASSGDTFLARRGSFDITIPASGELAALRQIEIRNKLETRAVITFIVDEGASVKAGDVLVRLADEEIKNKIKDAEDAVNTAGSAMIAAESSLAIRVSEGESEMDKANVAVQMAELGYRAWAEGEDVSKRKQLALAQETAEINHKRLVDRYAASTKLVEKDFISRDEYKRDEIAMIEGAAKLEQARLDIKVYDDYQRLREEAQKKSDVDQALAERERVKQRHAAELETVRADVASRRHQLTSAKDRLALLQLQLTFCTITAPTDGLVVYSTSLETNGWGRNEGQPPSVGTELRPNEDVIILPDTSQILANVKVNESLSGLIKPGQQAVVLSDAMPDVRLSGEVQGIGVLAETGGWRDPNRRDYTVRILLRGDNTHGLKPSMRCRAEIFVGRAEDAIHVPVQAVFREGPTPYVYVPSSSGYAQQAVTVGQSSELFIEIATGLDENDVVLLREPDQREVTARLSREQAPTQPQDRAAVADGGKRGPAAVEASTHRGAGPAATVPPKPGSDAGGGKRPPSATDAAK
jgi:HlyD family secretion protein